MGKFKDEICNLMLKDDFPSKLDQLYRYPQKRLVNSLISLLYSSDKLVKERAVLALGFVVSNMAKKDFEYARVVMRRLMLSLTEESGGIGWGAPEAMGEIMSRNFRLAEEYHQILISYMPGGGNDLEFEELQKDVIAGLQRLAGSFPELVEDVKHLL